MATITQRDNGSWQAKIRRRGYPPQSDTFRTKSLAERWARQVENDMDRGIFVDRSQAERTTLGDLLERYVVDVNPTLRGADKALGHLNTMRRDPLCDRIVATLRRIDFERFVDRMFDEDYAPDTITRRLNLFHRVFELAEGWGIHLPANPVSKVERPKGNKRTRRLMEGEEDKLLAACRASSFPHLAPAVETAVETVMRQGELLTLEWGSGMIDLAGRHINLDLTKNGDSRTVPLSMKAVRILTEIRKESGLVFAADANAFKLQFRRIADSVGMQDFRFHDLRHEGTSRLFERTKLRDLEIMAITGHKSPVMLKRYTHLRTANLAPSLDPNPSGIAA